MKNQCSVILFTVSVKDEDSGFTLLKKDNIKCQKDQDIKASVLIPFVDKYLTGKPER